MARLTDFHRQQASWSCCRCSGERSSMLTSMMSPMLGILIFSAVGPTGRAKKCVDAKCAPSAKHTASRTSWLYTCKESQDVPVNFPWKLTKDKVVKYQSLELAGWYQTVPNLRLQSQTGWHIAIESYLPLNWDHSGTYIRKSNIAEWVT
jgi:hypothetical protein